MAYSRHQLSHFRQSAWICLKCIVKVFDRLPVRFDKVFKIACIDLGPNDCELPAPLLHSIPSRWIIVPKDADSFTSEQGQCIRMNLLFGPQHRHWCAFGIPEGVVGCLFP